MDPKNTNSIIGVYSTPLRRRLRFIDDDDQDEFGGFVQVSRLGMPLVNEVVIPVGQKDRFNGSDPEQDAQFASFVQNPEPSRLIPVLYPGINVPADPRSDLVSIFLTGIPGVNRSRWAFVLPR